MEETPTHIQKQSTVRDVLASVWLAARVPIVAVVLAMLIGAVILLVSGANPVQAYAALFEGAFGDAAKFSRTLEKATPLIFSGLAVAFAFKAGMFNIGAQGQLLFGALVSAWLGFGIKGLPIYIHAPLALLGGAMAGGLYAAIPGALKTFTGAHEVITTIMLNFVAFNITDYLADGPLKDLSAGNIVARTPLIEDTARIGSLGIIPIGFLIALACAFGTWWLLRKTTTGFEIRTVGINQYAARYAGIRVPRTIILAMVISGILAGFGGAIETQGVIGRYQPGFNSGLGFDGITIALIGKTSPFGVIPASLLVGAMQAGSSQMQFNAGVAKEITDVIQALILFFVAADVIVRWIIRSRKDTGEPGLALSSGWGAK